MKVLFLSTFVLDYIYRMEGDFPLRGDEIRAVSLEDCAAGGPAITMICAKRLGIDVLPVGAVGKDESGAEFLRILQREGISAQGIEVREDYHTPKVLVAVDRSGRHSFLFYPDRRLNASAEPEDMISPCDAVSLSGYTMADTVNLPITMAYLEEAKRQKKLVFFDPGPLIDKIAPEEYLRMLRNADILVLNLEEAQKTAGPQDPAGCALTLQKAYGGQVVVKDGARGCYCCSGGDVIHRRSFPVVPVNTNGAGDTFLAGLMKGISQSLPLGDAAAVGNAAAAIKVSRGGAADRTPTLRELRKFLAEQGIVF